jgi:uncharacterized protein DUF2380
MLRFENCAANLSSASPFARFHRSHVMPRHLLASTVFALTAILSGQMLAGAEAPPAKPIAVAIDDFSYLDTSGEPTDQAAAHSMRLQQFMAALRRDVEADNAYQRVTSSCTPSCVPQNATTSDRLRIAKAVGATILITGAIHKMSTLVQWAKVSAIDTGTSRVLLDMLYTFRGDNDEAWQRSEAFVSRDIRSALTAAVPALPAAAPTPVKLAIFDFELEDTSAATSQIPSDATELANTTEAIRRLFEQSALYRVVATGGDAGAAEARVLHDCGGCDAPIALKQGADQSFVGVIRRISRTEYTIRFQLRDARTGTVIAAGDTGLRMGANYSWSRGAVRLVRDHLLEAQPRQ